MLVGTLTLSLVTLGEEFVTLAAIVLTHGVAAMLTGFWRPVPDESLDVGELESGHT